MPTSQWPEYIERFLAERRELVVVIEPHAVRSRPSQAPVTSQHVHRLVEDGEIQVDDCREHADRPYDKYCVTLYFPQDERTLKAILTVNWTTWGCQVETVWAYPGRKTAGRSARSRKGDRDER